MSRLDWERSNAEKRIQERGADSIMLDRQEIADAQPERKIGKKEKRQLALEAERKGQARERRRRQAQLERDVRALPAHERRAGAEWIRRQVRELQRSSVTFEKLWTQRFAPLTGLGAFDDAPRAERPAALGRAAKPKSAAAAGAASSSAATTPELVHALVAANPAALTPMTAATVLAGGPVTHAVERFTASRWWGRCSTRSRASLTSEINTMVRRGALARSAAGTLTVG